jgi:hypothetical protein
MLLNITRQNEADEQERRAHPGREPLRGDLSLSLRMKEPPWVVGALAMEGRCRELKD